MNTFLASYPRSGSSWFRSILKDYVGQDISGTVYIPGKQNGLIVKTHRKEHPSSKAILLVRNPYDCLYSAKVFWPKFYNQELDFNEQSTELNSFVFHYLNHFNKLLAVRYEDMHNHGTKLFTEVIKFMNLELDMGRLQDSIKKNTMDTYKREGFPDVVDSGKPDQKDIFFRKGKMGDGIDNLTEDQIKIINSNCKGVFEKFKYECYE